MNTRAIAFAASLALSSSVSVLHADILAYYPLNGAAGTTAVPNVLGSAPSGSLFNNAAYFTDPVRGQVATFDGAGDYAALGDTTIPAIGLNTSFTWAFWAYQEGPINTSVVLGNRYNPAGGEFSPREFIKFTPQRLEFHRNGAGNDVSYGASFVAGVWAQHTAIKNGPVITYFRDGHYAGRTVITEGLLNPQPLYLGGNAATESWQGRIDDVGLWTNAIPVANVAKLASGTATPGSIGNGAAYANKLSDNFSSTNALWNATNRGLENNNPAGYNAPNISGGTLTLGGTTTSQYWYGSSYESAQAFPTNQDALVSVDRLSLTGSGSAFRSSLWIYGDATHYLHFSQNYNEGGWTFNFNDGSGGASATGAGINIPGLDSLDGDQGSHNMSVQVVPYGTPGQVWMYLMLDGNVFADQQFANFPSTFNVILTGQARAAGDSVSAVFDNALVQQVPEPGSAVLLGGSLAFLATRRRREQGR
jgi:hypothetical protein